MSDRIGNKTPAQIYNDLFYLNNSNIGIDSEVRSVYSGNGVATPLKIGVEKMEADFGKGSLKTPTIDSYHLRFNDIGDVTGNYQISTTGGNIQKMRLTGNVSLTVLSNVEVDTAFEITLIVEQSVGNNSIVFPNEFKTTGHTSISFSANPGSIDILKLINYNGDTWLVYKSATDLR